MTGIPRTGKQWLADAGAVFSLLFVLIYVVAFVQYQRISMNPARAEGTLGEKVFIKGDGENSPRYLLRYRFTARTGDQYQGQAAVTDDFFQTASVGSQLEIEYAADDPGNNRVRGQFDPDALLYAALAVMGAALFVYLGPRRCLGTWRGEPDPVLS